jgi:hypothetical protein
MMRIALTPIGALAALAFSAATAHRPGGDPGAPTPIDAGFDYVSDAGRPWVGGTLWH